jgi:predicted RNA-binding Zn-ribbon protein involved in translation (DUF1610 family)
LKLRRSDIQRRGLQNFCPKCGFQLRFVDGRPWCSYCRTYPFDKKMDFTNILSQIENRLRSKFGRTEKQLKNRESQQIPLPRTSQVRTGIPPPRVTVSTPIRVQPSESITSIEDEVFKYIETHNGEISLSKAAEELEISPQELQITINKLKSGGFLGSQEEARTDSNSPRISQNQEQVQELPFRTDNSDHLESVTPTPIPVRQKVCINCSRLIELEARYCPNCGQLQP